MKKDFNKFDDITHMPLRVYNRTVFAHNLMEDSGVDTTKEYLAQFSDAEKAQIFILMQYIKQHGKDGVKKAKEFATRDLEVSDDWEEEVA